MHLVQILLPVRDNTGFPFEQSHFEPVAGTLSKKFGGATAYNRAPAEASGTTQHDEGLVMEVMVDGLDRKWWAAFRRSLEKTFRQEQIVARAQLIDLL